MLLGSKAAEPVETTLAGNTRPFRKERSLTQEQLLDGELSLMRAEAGEHRTEENK